MPTVRSKAYGSDENPTIYYLTGYTGTIRKYRPHIYALLLGGFRILAFEYDTAVLDSGEPSTLIQTLKDIESAIQKDKEGREIAGIYGVSLGSWLGLNAMVACDLKKGMFNTAGTSIARGVWELPRLKKEKATYRKHGYDRQDLEKAWGHYDKIADFSKRLSGAKIVVLNSTTDEIIKIDEARENIQAWQQDDLEVELITSTGLKHGSAITRHMLRLRKTLRFFKDTKKQKQEVVSYPHSNRRG